MDVPKLQTASTYINNLLLARGLLRNGTPIEFAQLASTADSHSGKEARQQSRTSSTAVAEVINLVHDLILRRDRDQDHSESLAHTLRTLRTEQAHTSTALSRLQTRNTDLTRQLALAQSAARSAQTAAHSADASARSLREELARVKQLLAQVRTQCANDVRKRDVQIQKLKAHLEARQRGNKTGLVGASITISPGSTGRANGARTSEDGNNSQPSLEDAEYSLRQESTEFLTQLSQGLSDENDSLIALVRSTIGTLKELQGLPHNQPDRIQGTQAASRQGTYSVDGSEELVQNVAVSYQTLATDLESVLGSLTDLLTNPSFAPVEEVHVREEEIQRLKEGWEKMDSRWTEAVAMMQGWQKRMLSGGDTVNLEELKKGLVLGEGLDSPYRRPIISPLTGRGSADHDESEHAEDSYIPGADQEPPDAEDLPDFDDDTEEEEAPLFADEMQAAPVLYEQKHQAKRNSRHLKEKDTNATTSPQRTKVAYDPVERENTEGATSPGKRCLESAEDSSPLPVKPTTSHISSPAEPREETKPTAAPSVRPMATKSSTMPRPRKNVSKSATSTFRNTTITSSARPTTSSRRRSPRPSSQAQHKPSSALTVEEKLELASREAEARRLRGASPSSDGHSSTKMSHGEISEGRKEPANREMDNDCDDKAGSLPHDDDEYREQLRRGDEDRDAATAPVQVRKRKWVGLGVGLGRPRRRKSTLSPDELQELMGA